MRRDIQRVHKEWKKEWLSLDRSDQKGQPTLRPQKPGNKGSVPGYGTLLWALLRSYHPHTPVQVPLQ